MQVNDRVGREIQEGDFVVYVTAGDRHPVLEFGWVLGFPETKSYGSPSGNFRIKIQRADPDGTRQSVTAVDVGGHWHEDTPDHIKNRGSDHGFYSPTRADYENYYVHTTYRDTGKPSTTSLEVSTKTDNRNNRLLVTQPV